MVWSIASEYKSSTPPYDRKRENLNGTMMKTRIVPVLTAVGLISIGLISRVATKTASAQGPQIPQGHQSQTWLTANADPQRDSWVRRDPHVSVRNIKNAVAGFAMVRKVRLENNPEPGQIESQPIFEPVAGGYKSMGYILDAAGNAVGVDSDTSQIIWKTPLATNSPPGAGNCSTPNAALTRMAKEWVPKYYCPN
jgi:hypothetical protein